MLHYNPQHVSSITLLIFRRTNCIITTSGIVTMEIGERSYINKIGSFTYFQSNDTRGYNNTVCPPEDEQGTARNMLRIVM